MRKFVIERGIPNAGKIADEQLRGAAAKSNAALAQLAPHVQWVQSYVADDRLFCIYLADEEKDVHKHARSEEHTSELQSLMRISYAVFCLKKKKKKPQHKFTDHTENKT